jgi:hypothetical protein
MATDTQPKLTNAFELFKPSIEILKKYSNVYAVLLLLPTALIILDTLLGTESIISFIGLLLTFIFFAPLIYAEVRTAGGHSVTLEESFKKGYTYFWQLLGLIIVTGIIIFIGLILFIIPGLILIRRYILAPYFMVDQDLDISEAMEAAAKQSKPFSWSLYPVIGVTILISLIAVFGRFGMLVSTIVSLGYSLAFALIYFEVKKAYKALPKDQKA